MANKITTYQKAVAAEDKGYYQVALSFATTDWLICSGEALISNEKRGGKEVKYISGLNEGDERCVMLIHKDNPLTNLSFFATPTHLVASLVNERGIFPALDKVLLGLYLEKKMTVTAGAIA